MGVTEGLIGAATDFMVGCGPFLHIFTALKARKERKIMKLRTVKGFWRELKEADPNCAVGLPRLRAAVDDGTIPSFTAGRRRLIDADEALSYLFYAERVNRQQPQQPGEVRKVE